MTLIPEVHDALASAVAARRPAGRWWRPSRRGALLAVGAVLATGTAVAATNGWHPVLGDDHRGHPRESTRPLPADQLAALAVLRRAQTDADRTPAVRAVLRLLPRGEINGIHVDGIRLLRTRPDGVTVLVPTERVGRHDRGHRSSIRRDVLCVLVSVGSAAGSGAGQTCGDVEQLRTTGIGGTVRTQAGWINYALVPDGVARVIVRLRRHRAVAAPVRANLYAVNTGNEIPPAWGVRWLDADGKRIEHRKRR